MGLDNIYTNFERSAVMKNQYETPMIDVILFENEDVCTASPGNEVEIDSNPLD